MKPGVKKVSGLFSVGLRVDIESSWGATETCRRSGLFLSALQPGQCLGWHFSLTGGCQSLRVDPRRATAAVGLLAAGLPMSVQLLAFRAVVDRRRRNEGLPAVGFAPARVAAACPLPNGRPKGISNRAVSRVSLSRTMNTFCWSAGTLSATLCGLGWYGAARTGDVVRGTAGVRIPGENPACSPLSPLARSARWAERVNEPLKAAEMKAIRTSVNRAKPLGDRKWVQRTSRQLNLQSTLRPRGGSEKES